MMIAIYREAAVIPKGPSPSGHALYWYSFEPIGDLGPWDYIDVPDDARLERGREDYEVDSEPFLDDISDLRLVFPDGGRLDAVSALQLFSDARAPEVN